jgi:hypothetical protein
MRPPPPVPAPAPKPPAAVPRVEALPSDRPTPRSTVIPRLPAPVVISGMRPQLQTLIFHGAPPPPPASPPRARSAAPSPVSVPPPSSGGFDSVASQELLDDVDLEEDTESELAPPPPSVARTERPPPIVAATRPHARELRIIVGITAALALPIGIAAVWLDRGAHDAPVAHAVTPPVPAAPKPAARAPGTCAVDGAPKVLARRALIRGGVEATELDDRVAFAAMTSPKSGAAFELDARTLALKGSTKVVASGAVTHVVPELDSDAPIDAQVDMTALRTIPDAEGEVAFGARDGYVVWGPRDGDGMVRLWRLPWPQVVEASRVVPVGTSGERLAVFRRTNAIWVGSFRGGQTTSDLLRVSTSPYAGAPALDARGDDAVLAWAEREANGPWGVRWARWSTSAGVGPTHALALPPGGPGERAMAPSVAALGEGRFLLGWTETGHGKNQVRAEVIDAADHPSGEPIAVSPPDAVAGQETIALTDSGRGAIAYLVARRGAFELRASAIDCSR